MISDIIDQLKATASKNEKIAILNKYKDLHGLRQLFELTYSPRIKWWIRANTDSLNYPSGDREITEKFLDRLRFTISNRALTGNAAREFLDSNLRELLTKERQVIINMINRDQDCGVQVETINKIWKNTIPVFPVMLASKLDEKTVLPFLKSSDMIVQTKEDGGRVSVLVDTDVVEYKSRNGNNLELRGVFDSIFLRCGTTVMLDGELLVETNGKTADRKTGNGIYNKAVRGTISESEAQCFKFVLWDTVDLKQFWTGNDSTPYSERLKTLRDIVAKISDSRIVVVDSQEVKSFDDARKFYNSKISLGLEGAIVKIANSPWEADRSKNQVKLKQELDATLYCYAVKPHSKKSGMIGSLECRSSCGKIDVSIGSGLTDKDREQPDSYFIDKLVDVKYNDLIQSKGKTTWSMFLPIFQGLRLDQSEADTLEKLK